MIFRDLGKVSGSHYFQRWASEPVLRLTDSLDQQWFREFLPRPGSTLLLGSGPGRELLWLRAYADAITCVDYDREAIAAGQHMFGSEGIAWLNEDFMTYAFGDNNFDTALALGLALAYVSDVAEALSVIYRLLKPGGHVILSLPNAEHLHEQGIVEKRNATGVYGRHSFCTLEIDELLCAADFSVVEIRGQRFLLDFVPSSTLLNQDPSLACDSRLRDLVALEQRWSRYCDARAAKLLWAIARKPETGFLER